MSGYDHSHPETYLDKLALLIEEGLEEAAGFNNKHPEYHYELKLRTSFLPRNTPIRERLWHIANKTDQKPICHSMHCSKPTRWWRYKRRHTIYCSCHCERQTWWDKKKNIFVEVNFDE